MGYVYRMVQLPPTIAVAEKDHEGNEAAKYLQEMVNAEAANGWEFYRVDPIGVQVQPGCLGGLLGRKTVEYTHYVVSFRSQK